MKPITSELRARFENGLATKELQKQYSRKALKKSLRIFVFSLFVLIITLLATNLAPTSDSNISSSGGRGSGDLMIYAASIIVFGPLYALYYAITFKRRAEHLFRKELALEHYELRLLYQNSKSKFRRRFDKFMGIDDLIV